MKNGSSHLPSIVIFHRSEIVILLHLCMYDLKWDGYDYQYKIDIYVYKYIWKSGGGSGG